MTSTSPLLAGYRPASRPILVNLSGGLDSTYLLWALLTSGHRVLVHHCQLRNWTGRWQAETRAVEQIVGWLRGNGLDRFEMVVTQVDLSDLGFTPYDVEVVGWLTGTILRDRRRREVKTVALSSNRHDPTVVDATVRRGRVRKLLAEGMADRQLDWWWAIAHLTKADMAARMPAELFAACWWCRRPVPDGTCGRCKPCQEMAAV